MGSVLDFFPGLLTGSDCSAPKNDSQGTYTVNNLNFKSEKQNFEISNDGEIFSYFLLGAPNTVCFTWCNEHSKFLLGAANTESLNLVALE